VPAASAAFWSGVLGGFKEIASEAQEKKSLKSKMI
jgi:hypothetical protein